METPIGGGHDPYTRCWTSSFPIWTIEDCYSTYDPHGPDYVWVEVTGEFSHTLNIEYTQYAQWYGTSNGYSYTCTLTEGSLPPLWRRILLRWGHRLAVTKAAGIGEWLLLLGGTLAVSASITLLIWLAIRPGASINPNAVTLGLGLIGGTITLVYPNRLRVLVAANFILWLAAAPTVFGMAWLLYVPPIVFVATGTVLMILHRYFAHRRLPGSSR